MSHGLLLLAIISYISHCVISRQRFYIHNG